MADVRDMPKRPWDTCREVPVIDDEQTPWKLIKLLKIIALCLVGLIVFGTALCSKTSFLLLITFANVDTKIFAAEQKPVALLCIACALVTSSVLLFLKSIWKACYKTSKLPRKTTIALVLFFEFVVSLGAAILTIVAMPHLDIVTNVTIFNGVAILSSLLQVVVQCTAKERNRFLLPSITGFVLLLFGYGLFVYLYITKDLNDVQTAIWVGLAVGGSFLVAFNWWENYFKLISQNSSSVFLRDFCKDVTKCQNVLNILSSLLRIAVTAAVVGAYVPLSKLDWEILNSIPSRQTRIIAITIGVQLISSALCQWFAVAACKMHALRRCFILPLYLASLGVMVLLVVPVIVYYQDYRISLNGTATNWTSYCEQVIYPRDQSLNGSVFPDLVNDVSQTLCFLDMSTMTDIGILTGSAVSWWLGLLLVTLHLWYLSVYRIQRTGDLFVRRLYEGAFIEQSLLLNTRFDVQTRDRKKFLKSLQPIMVYLCATMWHETYDEMMNIIISIFRLDKYRPKINPQHNDFTFEAHIYFDDAFQDAEDAHGRQLNKYARNLIKVFVEVYGIFTDMDSRFFSQKQDIPEQRVIRTPYGGRVLITMPHGNTIVVHFKDKELIRHKKRWSQVMYLFYLFGWKLMTKYYGRWQKGEDEKELREEVQREKHNTYLLALDGDTDFQPTSVMLLIDRLRMYPLVGAACGRIHPTGSGPAVWFQKFEYAVSHWLQKTAEHVIGCVLCSPGCFSLFRAEALMDDNVMKRYSTKSSEASHYIQYDQGEDRWLCTLLLKQGWRVEYNAASDAFTNAPEDFKELYNQRRRWGPSTLANVVDLLGDTSLISKRNPSISKPFMFYQLFAITSAILAPATIVLLTAGSMAFIFNIHASGALVMAVIPPAIYLGLCFKLKTDTQILVGAILSIIYAFLMLVVTMSIIGSMVKDQTILTPSSLFVVIMAGIYIVTAILHPQEFPIVFYGFLYILCIPSAYLLLTIYSMVNMNNVSWGTRETKSAAADPSQTPAKPQTRTEKAKSSIARFFSSIKCCKKNYCGNTGGGQHTISQEVLVVDAAPEPEPEPEVQPPAPLNTIVEDERIPKLEGEEQQQQEDERQLDLASSWPTHSWVADLQNLSVDLQLQEDMLDEEETQFWDDLQEKYLKPLPDDKERQKKIAADLIDLRNKINFAFFIMNALWLVATFTLQLFDAAISIRLPKVDFNLESTGEDVVIDPIGFMFILGFATSVIIQFFAMIYHRIYTLIHYVAFLDTEPVRQKLRQQQEDLSYSLGKKLEESSSAATSQRGSDGEESGDEDEDDDDFPPRLYGRNDIGGGTLV